MSSNCMKLLCLLGIMIITEGAEIRHIEADGSHLVDTTSSNYAITAPNLYTMGWKAISVNGNRVSIQSPNCQLTTRALESLSASEVNQLRLIKSNLESIEANPVTQQSLSRYSVTRQSLSSTVTMRNSISKNINSSSFQMNGASITKSDDNNYSINGQVQMKSLNCLDRNEQQLIQQLRAEIIAAEHNMQIQMQNMQQNMFNMQANMQQAMQGMKNNMFGNGFPYYGGNQMMQQQQQFAPNHMMANSLTGMNYAPPYYGNGYAISAASNPSSNGIYPNIAGMSMPSFGDSWPFGQRNNPFGPGFPFTG